MYASEDVGLPRDQQEVDCSTPLREFDPRDAAMMTLHPRQINPDRSQEHLIRCLEIAKSVLTPEWCDVLYRCFYAYAAGFVGNRALTAKVTALDYWYVVGRKTRVDMDERYPEEPCARG